MKIELLLARKYKTVFTLLAGKYKAVFTLQIKPCSRFNNKIRHVEGSVCPRNPTHAPERLHEKNNHQFLHLY